MSSVSPVQFKEEVQKDLDRQYIELWDAHYGAKPDQLFHYTTTAALVGIASTKKLYLSDMLASTDQSEIYHGLDIALDVLRTQFVPDRLVNHLIGILETFKTHGVGQRIYVYAICFCSKDDVLTQWRGYAQGVGVAVGVDVNQVMRMRSSMFGPMVYEREAQRNIIQKIVTCGQSWLQKLPSDDALDVLFQDTFIHLFKSLMFFKHEAFQSEAEWRMLDLISDSDLMTVKFRNRGADIIPYRELDIGDGLIKQIRCSPGYWSKSALHGVHTLARTLGTDVQVTQSTIPL